MDNTAEGHALPIFYRGWEDYQELLLGALAPLTPEQLDLRAAPGLRSIDEIARHMVGARARWLRMALQEGGPDVAAVERVDAPGAPALPAAEIVAGLRTTWQALRAAVDRWAPADWTVPLERDDDDPDPLTRAWVVWHLVEHDLHHGGEISFSLGMHGLAAPDI